MARRFLRDFPSDFDPVLSGDRRYNPFSREFYSTLEDLLAIDGTAMTDEDIDSSVLFGTLRGSVVGLHCCTGVVHNNEMVALQREPDNQYDVNAIKVNRMNGEQVGYIIKELTTCLAHIMDNKLALIEGAVPYRPKNAFTMPVKLSFWGKADNKQAVIKYLKAYDFKLAPPPPGKSLCFGYSWTSENGGTSHNAPRHAAVQMTTEELKTELDRLFEDLKEYDDICEMEAVEAVVTPLLPHQKQDFTWMISRENSRELPTFWKERNNYFYNTITNFADTKRPENVLGGILADDMGKMLTTIAVILTNFHDGKPLPLEKKSGLSKEKYASAVKRDLKAPRALDTKKENDAVLPQSSCPESRGKKLTCTASNDVEPEEKITQKANANAKKTQPGTRNRRKGGTAVQSKAIETKENPRATLIICPLSVLSNWTDQLEEHIDPDVHLNIYVYYGSECSKDPVILSTQDIVLTTYDALFIDYCVKSNSPLHQFKWLRLVLDEGHTIQNAHQIKAILDLDAQRRWILTGTSIPTSLKDLWHLLSFLKLKPFTDREWWHRTIERPFTMGHQDGLERLYSLLMSIARITKPSEVKGKEVLKLPERNIVIQHITLSDEENQIYNSVKKESTAVISRYFKEGTVLTHYIDVLGALLRLRQLCCHPHLCASDLSSTCEEGNITPEELHGKLIEKVKLILNSGSEEECVFCLDSFSVPVITPCGHVCCMLCICKVTQSEKRRFQTLENTTRKFSKCPLCSKELTVEQVKKCPVEVSVDAKMSDQEWVSSSKINALMNALLDLRKQNPAIKSIIISQFPKFLSIIEVPLRKSGFVFTWYYWKMEKKKRTEAIQQFKRTIASSPSVMLLPLTSSILELNLTAASRIFLMDPAWDSALEDLCFERCLGLKQKQDVVITKFIVKNSVEENMLKIQNKKRELTAGAFGTKKPTFCEIKINEIKTLMDL